MESQPETLFGSYTEHSDRWKAAADVDLLHCPGKDTLDTNCKCPDVTYSTRIRIATAETIYSYILCGCCDRTIKP